MNNNLILLNKVPTALAFVNKEGYLVAYNKKLCEIWSLQPSFLDTQPYLITFLEVIRESGVYPEKSDFRSYCNELESKLKRDIPINIDEQIFLYSGEVFSEKIVSDENGITFMWEDISDKWNTTSSLHNSKQIYKRIIENNPLPIFCVASSGIIELTNEKFLSAFDIKPTDVNDRHLKDILTISSSLQAYFDVSNNKEMMIGKCLGSSNFKLNLFSSNNNELIVLGISLPNGSMLVSIQKSSSYDNSISMDKMEKSFNNLYVNLAMDFAYSLGAPISSIIGFADIIQNEYIGKLNLKQKNYISKIINTAEKVNKSINYRLQIHEFENTANLQFDNVDINTCFSHIIHNIKDKIKSKSINLQLDIPNETKDIQSNEELLTKAATILLFYLLEQNQNHGEIIIEVSQDEYQTIINIKDTSSLPLLTNIDIEERYDIQLAFNILKKLRVSVDYKYKDLPYREISLYIN